VLCDLVPFLFFNIASSAHIPGSEEDEGAVREKLALLQKQDFNRLKGMPVRRWRQVISATSFVFHMFIYWSVCHTVRQS